MKDLTIIIPPHNRHACLNRILEYYSDLNIKILIGDSSDVEYPEKDKLNTNIQYFFFKGFSFADKVDELIKKVETKYTLIIAEDDFYIADSISKCINFLNCNPSYSSCQGNYTFFSNQSPINHHPGYLQSYKRDINANSSVDRLKQLFKDYFQMFYCIHTTKTLKDLFEFAHSRITSMFSVEILLACAALIHGKHKVLPIYYGSREINPLSVGQTHDNFLAIATKKKYEKEYYRLIDYLALELSKADGISKNNSELEILKIFELYLKRNYRFLRFLLKVYGKVLKLIRVERRDEDKIQNKIIAIRELEGFPFNGNSEEANWIQIQKCIQKYNNK